MRSSPYLVYVAISFFINVNVKASDEVVYRDGTNVLTKQQFAEQVRSLHFGDRDDLRRALLMAKAGAALIPHYRELLVSSKDPVVVGVSARAIIRLAEDPVAFRDDLLGVFSREDLLKSYGFQRLAIPVVKAVGKPEDCEFLIPVLLDEEYSEIRAVAAEVLAMVGDEKVLTRVESLSAELDRLHERDIATLPQTKEKLIAGGSSEAFVVRAIAQKEQILKRHHQRVKDAISELRSNVRGARPDSAPGTTKADVAAEDTESPEAQDGVAGDSASPDGKRSPPLDGRRLHPIGVGLVVVAVLVVLGCIWRTRKK